MSTATKRKRKNEPTKDDPKVTIDKAEVTIDKADLARLQSADSWANGGLPAVTPEEPMPAPDLTVAAAEEPVNSKVLEAIAERLRWITIEIPIGPVDPEKHSARHIDVQLTRDQAAAHRAVYNGLDAAGIRLKDGRRIATAADVLRYLCERIGDGVSFTTEDTEDTEDEEKT